jgi:hypothetical protein
MILVKKAESDRCKKATFARKIDADYYIDKLQKTSNRAKIPKYSYLCPKCNLWHLTSKEYPENIRQTLNKYLEIINELQVENSKLRIEKNELKSKTNNQIAIVVKTDSRIAELNKQVKTQKETINRLRETISNLVTESVQLKKKIEELTIVI